MRALIFTLAVLSCSAASAQWGGYVTAEQAVQRAYVPRVYPGYGYYGYYQPYYTTVPPVIYVRRDPLDADWQLAPRLRLGRGYR